MTLTSLFICYVSEKIADFSISFDRHREKQKNVVLLRCGVYLIEKNLKNNETKALAIYV